MDTLKLRRETPREIASLAYDMGRGAVRQFIRHMNETPVHTPGAAVEEPLESALWPHGYMSDDAVNAFVEVMREMQVREAAENAA